jgi:hypothetical protein
MRLVRDTWIGMNAELSLFFFSAKQGFVSPRRTPSSLKGEQDPNSVNHNRGLILFLCLSRTRYFNIYVK